MSKFVCIHAHFYQPPRENAWLEEVERQNSAYPYHDWNERITTECYAPNTAARLLGDDGLISHIVNNYARISFNFGPTLLSWIEKHEPQVYAAILEADRLSRTRFSGHGSALAQVYNHIIMPLANRRDKITQIKWGIEDFVHRFDRAPEGMWLAETAVDLETLDLLVAHGIKFTVLAPNQASRIRAIGDKEWTDVSGDKIDPRRPYRCRLPSGESIDLFIYDGRISQEVAFGSLLRDGSVFAEQVLATLDDESEEPQLAHIATDGETYGHHQQHGDMALAYCLRHIESSDSAEITVYGEYLEEHPPEYEIEIFQNSSWSCAHGVERWRADCGCRVSHQAGWNQAWRTPLRNAMDWLRDSLAQVYEEQAPEYLQDPWEARNQYISVIMDRTARGLEAFFERQAPQGLSEDARVQALRLLEMQRHALLMYTSCAWFFDEISGIETVQVLQYSARAIQLTRAITGIDLEPSFKKILKMAPSNMPNLAHGSEVYDRYVIVNQLDLARVAVHYAIISLVDVEWERGNVYCYDINEISFNRLVSGRQSLGYGQLEILSTITREKALIHFMALHFGEHNILAGVQEILNGPDTSEIESQLSDTFNSGDISRTVSLMEKHYGENRFSLRHLFRDDQRRIISQLVAGSLQEMDFMFRRQFQHNSPLISVMSEINIQIPRSIATTVDYVCNTDLRQAVEASDIDLERIRQAIDQADRFNAELDRVTLGFLASRRIVTMIQEMKDNLFDLAILEVAEGLLSAAYRLELPLNLWRAQNIFFNLKQEYGEGKIPDADKRTSDPDKWSDLMKKIGLKLKVGL